MKQRSLPGEIEFERILNFREPGGCAAAGGHHVAWRRLFRSGGLWDATQSDVLKPQERLGLKSVLDLRDMAEVESRGCRPVRERITYVNVPLSTDSGNLGAADST